MNLLPFVLVIVLILGMFSASFFSKTMTLEKDKDAYVAYFKGRREIRNQMEDLAYQKSLKSKEDSPSEKQEDFVYFREKWMGSTKGQLNLFLLLGDDPAKTTLYPLALDYINQLYGNTLLAEDKNLGKTLLDHLIKMQKKILLPLNQITLKDPLLQEIYYKMLRGTNSYNLEAGKGYPPLYEMITFEKTQSRPLNFNYINPYLMEVIFGEKISQEVIEAETNLQKNSEESKVCYALKKADLYSILGKYNNPELLSLLSFEISQEEPPIVWKDKKTGITVK